jgi:hypothetical protein
MPTASNDPKTFLADVLAALSPRKPGAEPIHGSRLELAGPGSETLDEYRRRMI